MIFKRYKTEIFLFFLAFGIRFIYAVAIQFLYSSHGFAAYSDAESFIAVANNLLRRGVFSQMTEPPFLPDPLRTFSYPAFLAPFLYFNLPLFFIAAFQGLMAGITAVLIYKAGKIIFKSDAAGVLAAALFAFEPISIYWNNLLMSDVLFSFLFFLAFYLFIIHKFYLFAFVLGLAALTRPIGLYFAPLFLAAFIVMNYRTHSKLFLLKKTILISFLFFIVLFPWLARNKILFDTWSLSSAGLVNHYIFSFSRFASEQGIVLPELAKPEGLKGDAKIVFTYDFANIPFYKNGIKNLIFDHPLQYIKFHLKYFFKTFDYHGYDYLMDNVIRAKFPQISKKPGDFIVGAGRAVWWLIYAFAAAAFFKKEYRVWSFFLLLFVVTNNFLLIASGVSQGGRYGMPVMPMVFLLAGFGAVYICGIFRHFYLIRIASKF